MIVYLFGNEDHPQDSRALEVVDQIRDTYSEINFRVVKPNEDLPFVGQKYVYLMDVVQGIPKPQLRR